LITVITIISVIVFFLEFKAQCSTHDIGIFFSDTTLQIDENQGGNFVTN